MSRAIIMLLVVLAVFFANTDASRLICNRPNEMYACGSACQTTCENLGKPCPIINIRCNDACYCIDGYARKGGNDGPCIPQERCHKRGRQIPCKN